MGGKHIKVFLLRQKKLIRHGLLLGHYRKQLGAPIAAQKTEGSSTIVSVFCLLHTLVA